MLKHNRIERNASLIYHQDGLVDIFLALVLLVFALGIEAGMAWMGGAMAAVLTPNWLNAKRLITAPRLAKAAREGTGKRQAGRTDPLSAALIVGLLVFGLMVFALLIIGLQQGDAFDWLRANGDLAFGLLLAVFLALLGTVLGARRFYAYAILAVGLVLAAGWLTIPLWTTIALLTGCILLCGGLILAAFLRRNPL